MVEFDENLNPINNAPEPQRPTPSPSERPAAPTFTPPPPPAGGSPRPSMAAPEPMPPRGGTTPVLMLVAIVAVVMIAFVGLNQLRLGAPTGSGQPEGITASAEGTAYITPNVAKLTFGVSKTGRTVGEVNDQMSAVINQVKSELTKFGVKDKDVQTTGYSLYPERDYRAGNIPRITSYTGRHILTVTIRDLDQVNGVLDAVTSAGVNEVNDVVFTTEDPDAGLEAARADAIKRAKDKAKQAAEAAGVGLGRLVSINEYVDRAMSNGRYIDGLGGGGAAPGVEPGSLEARITVTLTYSIS